MVPLHTILVEKADACIEKALRELQKPEDNIVPFVICNNSNNAVRWLVCSWFEKNNITYDSHLGLYELIEFFKLNARGFEMYSFNILSCQYHSDDQNYCLSLEKVNHCLKLALSLQEFVHNDQLVGHK